MGCECYEFLVIAPGLRSISGSFGGLRRARKRAIAIWVIAQRRLEFFQGLRRLIHIEQQLAEHFTDRREAIFHRDGLAASIFEVGGLAHRRNGIHLSSLGERQPSAGGLLLDGNLSRPIIVVGLGKLVLEHAELIDCLPAFTLSPLRAAPIARPNHVIASACAKGVFGIASSAASAQAARSNA